MNGSSAASNVVHAVMPSRSAARSAPPRKPPVGTEPSGGRVIAWSSSGIGPFAALEVLDGRQDHVQAEIDQVHSRDRNHGLAREHDASIEQPIRELEECQLIVGWRAQAHAALSPLKRYGGQGPVNSS